MVPMREYNEDPAVKTITSPKTFAAHRRINCIFFDKCAEGWRLPSVFRRTLHLQTNFWPTSGTASLSMSLQPSLEVQRQSGVGERVGFNSAVIHGDMLHCDSV